MQGKSELAKMLSTVVVGDISAYLAVLEVDPTPVRTINLLKDTLKQNGVKEKIIAELDGSKTGIFEFGFGNFKRQHLGGCLNP